MTFNYSQSANTAIKLLTKFGRDITHVKTVDGAYDINTGSVTNTTVNTTVKAADFAYKANEYRADGLIQADDRYALIEPTLSALDVSDKLIIDGVTWNIVNVNRISPANVTVLYKVQIRK